MSTESISLDDSVSNIDPTPDWRRRVQLFGNLHADSSPSEPDAWIDDYYTGVDVNQPSSSLAQRPLIQVELPVYSGLSLSLHWFEWIDLFYSFVHQTGRSPGEKLAILKRSLNGDCLYIVHGFSGGEAAYKEALIRLKQTCGRRDVMRAVHLQALDNLSCLKGDTHAFKRFVEKVRAHLFDLTRIGETNHSAVIERICQRLQINDRLAWNEGQGGGLENRTLNEFGAWLCSRALAYQNAFSLAAEQLSSTQPGSVIEGSARSKERPIHRTHHLNAAAEGKVTSKQNAPFCYKCEQGHPARILPQIPDVASTGEDRVLCPSSIVFPVRYSSRYCHAKKKKCGVPECKLIHHKLLHDFSEPENVATAHSHSSRNEAAEVALGVLRLDVVAEDGGLVPINILVDEGSDTTLAREGFTRRIGIEGEERPLLVDGVGGAQSEYRKSQRIKLRLVTTTGSVVNIEAATVPRVTTPIPETDWVRLQHRWAHLRDLPIRSCGGDIDLLLGLDHGHLIAPLETRAGDEFETMAVLTQLGWIARGVIGSRTPRTARVNLVFGTQPEELASLTAAVNRFADAEAFGTEHQVGCLTPENQRAVALLEQGLRKLPIGYEAPIPWKQGEPQLLDNRTLAESRLRGLANRFRRDSAFAARYRDAMKTNFEDGYAWRLTVDEATSPGPMLGLVWHWKADSLGFRVITAEGVSYTRIGLLSKVASLFDPMGTAAPLVVKAKIRLRALGTRGLDWTTEIPAEDRAWWMDWFGVLQQLNNIEVPCCLIPNAGGIVCLELHTFCDASEEAYATVTYSRAVYRDGAI